MFRVLKSLALIAYCWIFGLSHAIAQPDWYSIRYEHFSQNEKLSDLLLSFSSDLGVPVVISKGFKTEGTKSVNGSFKNITAYEFLNKLSTLYQLVWYYDGQMLYINHIDEMQSEILHLNRTSTSELGQTVKKLGVWDSRFGWREMPDRDLLFISGTPRYIELIKEIANLIQQNEVLKQDSHYVVRVFQLQYASADDRTIRYRDSAVRVPGIATTISKIMARKTESIASEPVGIHQKTTAHNQSHSETVMENGKTNQMLLPEEKANFSPNYLNSKSTEPGQGAYIEANAQTNTVIVHDLESRMNLYQTLIQALDKASDQIEIEVSIVDVSTDRLSELGVEWEKKGPRGSFGVGDPKAGSSNADGFNLFTANKNLSTILAGNGSGFLGRVKLLAEKGDGQILSQPSVITMNNIEAVIDHSTTFFVKLEGQEAVDLKSISAGSVLRVTPRVIQEAIRRISLDVSIEDGTVSVGNASQQVDNLPVVSKSVINTQAMVDEGSSLLIGGYYYDRENSSTHYVPILGKIPVIKYLFNSQNKSRQKLARLFLITPRVVSREQSHFSEDLKRSIQRHHNQMKLEYQEPQLELLNVGRTSIFD